MNDFPDIDILNRKFGAPDRIAFRAGPAGLPVVTLACSYGAVEISLYGAHVLSYRPLGLGPALFLSRRSAFEPGKPIRGGIPICWPWFGKLPDQPEAPIHGFARLMQWELAGTSYTGTETELTLKLHDSELTRVRWPHAFELMLHLKLGQTLRMELTTRNTDKDPFTITQGFHTYFQISKLDAVQILGLQEARFEERAFAGRGIQHGPLLLNEEGLDKLFTPTKNEAAIYDATLQRTLAMTFSGTRNLVVWNPGAVKGAASPDLEPQDYTRFACVEAANTCDTAIDLEPGHKHTLTLSLQARHVPTHQ